MQQKLLVVDGTNVAHRAYYALKATPNGVPVSPSGEPVAATSIVLRSLLELLRQHNPTHVAVCFDNNQDTFRHKLFADYKAGRSKKDDLLVADLALFKSILCQSKMGIEAPAGIEADDLVATLSAQFDGTKLVYSADRDLLQLADDSTVILYPSSKKKTVLALLPADIKVMMQVYPNQISDYKALRGDATDNIPGIKGVGEKTAVDLLSRFQSIEDIYKNIGKITGRTYTLLKQGESDARLSKQLASLVMNATLPSTVESFNFNNFDIDAIAPILNDLGLHTIVRIYNDFLDSQF